VIVLYVITLDDITVWGMHQIVKPECGQHIYDFLDDAALYEHILPHDGAVAAVNQLRQEGHDLVAVTWSYVEDSLPGKVRWIQRHFDLGRANIFTGERKELLSELDVMVDDAPHNLQRCRERWGNQTLILGISWPYNQVARQYADLLAEDHNHTVAAYEQLLARIHAYAAGE
jgi:5'(3')-deoxyribonucleotidase